MNEHILMLLWRLVFLFSRCLLQSIVSILQQGLPLAVVGAAWGVQQLRGGGGVLLKQQLTIPALRRLGCLNQHLSSIKQTQFQLSCC